MNESDFCRVLMRLANEAIKDSEVRVRTATIAEAVAIVQATKMREATKSHLLNRLRSIGVNT